MAAFQVHTGSFAQRRSPKELASLFEVRPEPKRGIRASAFAPLTFPEWKSLGDKAERRSVPAKTVFCAQDELPRSVYIIEEGLLKLTRMTSDGTEVITGLRSRGWIIDAASTLLNRPYSSSAIAVTQCTIRYMARSTFINMLDNSPSLRSDVNQLICEEIETEHEQQIEFRCESAAHRLNRLLEELPGAISGANRLPLKNYEIAQMLSITPEHLSRLLH